MKRKNLLVIMIVTLFSLCGCGETNTIESKENISQEVREKEDSELKEVESNIYDENNSSHDGSNSSHDENHRNHHEDEHH